VAVLTDWYWQRTLGGNPSVVGQQIEVAGQTVTIVGVLQRGFRGLDLSESIAMYLPFHTIAQIGSPATNYFAEAGTNTSPTAGTMILGRLRPDVSRAEAIQRIAALEPATPGRSTSRETLLMTANMAAVPETARVAMTQFAKLLTATVGLLLLTGCTTVGMLLLIRTEARGDEFAMCLALGAPRARLVRGVVCEGAVLAAAGAILAIPIASWLFRLIQVFELPGNVPVESLELSLGPDVIAITIVTAAAAVLLVGLAAALLGFRDGAADALRSRSGGVTSRPSRRATRAVLVGIQVAITVILVTGAGLLARSLTAALRLNTDAEMSRLVMGTIELRSYGYTAERAAEFFDGLQNGLLTNPAIESMTLSIYAGGMTSAGKLQIDGVPRQFPSTVWYLGIDERYFRTMGIRLVAGRPFAVEDRPVAPPVAIVSASLARLVADGASPLDHRIARLSATDEPARVVGVVSDVVANVDVLEPLVIYLPAVQLPPAPYRDIIARVAKSASVEGARRAIVRAMGQIDQQIAPTPLRTFEERVLAQMAPQQFGATVLGSLGAIALLLTALGAYVVADSMATARMREMGIRAALGATRRQLGSMVLAETGRLVGAGICAGLLSAWACAGAIRSFLFEVEPLDPATLAVVCLLILLLAGAVSLRAALRSARVDLAAVLKAE
jgi:predicted permease